MAEEGEDVTVACKILLHLSSIPRPQEKYVGRRERTQEGIADALGISRGHAAVELKKLERRKMVKVDKAHIPEAKKNKNVYSLTVLGEMEAKFLKEDADRRAAASRFDGGSGRDRDDSFGQPRPAGA